jgi:hypothetical protein
LSSICIHTAHYISLGITRQKLCNGIAISTLLLTEKRGKKSLKKYSAFDKPPKKKKRNKKSRSSLFLYTIWYSYITLLMDSTQGRTPNDNLEAATILSTPSNRMEAENPKDACLLL